MTDIFDIFQDICQTLLDRYRELINIAKSDKFEDEIPNTDQIPIYAYQQAEGEYDSGSTDPINPALTILKSFKEKGIPPWVVIIEYDVDTYIAHLNNKSPRNISYTRRMALFNERYISNNPEMPFGHIYDDFLLLMDCENGKPEIYGGDHNRKLLHQLVGKRAGIMPNTNQCFAQTFVSVLAELYLQDYLSKYDQNVQFIKTDPIFQNTLPQFTLTACILSCINYDMILANWFLDLTLFYLMTYHTADDRMSKNIIRNNAFGQSGGMQGLLSIMFTVIDRDNYSRVYARLNSEQTINGTPTKSSMYLYQYHLPNNFDQIVTLENGDIQSICLRRNNQLLVGNQFTSVPYVMIFDYRLFMANVINSKEYFEFIAYQVNRVEGKSMTPLLQALVPNINSARINPTSYTNPCLFANRQPNDLHTSLIFIYPMSQNQLPYVCMNTNNKIVVTNDTRYTNDNCRILHPKFSGSHKFGLVTRYNHPIKWSIMHSQSSHKKHNSQKCERIDQPINSDQPAQNNKPIKWIFVAIIIGCCIVFIVILVVVNVKERYTINDQYVTN